MSNSTELLERALEELYTAYRGKRHFPDIFLDIHKYLELEKEGLCHWSFARGVLWAIERTKQVPIGEKETQVRKYIHPAMQDKDVGKWVNNEGKIKEVVLYLPIEKYRLLISALEDAGDVAMDKTTATTAAYLRLIEEIREEYRRE